MEKQVRELSEKATPGPWKQGRELETRQEETIRGSDYAIVGHTWGKNPQHSANAEFIVACVNYVRALLAKVVEFHKPGQLSVNAPTCEKCGELFLDCQCKCEHEGPCSAAPAEADLTPEEINSPQAGSERDTSYWPPAEGEKRAYADGLAEGRLLGLCEAAHVSVSALSEEQVLAVRLAKETIEGWVEDAHGKVYVHKDVVLKALNAALGNVEGGE